MSLWRCDRGCRQRANASVALAVVMLGCGSGTTTKLADTARPQSVVVNPQLTSTTLIWRNAPSEHRDARGAVHRFFAAVAKESNAELEALFAEDALFHRPNQPASPAAIAWQRRLSSGDYGAATVGRDTPVQLLDNGAAERLAGHRSIRLQPQSGELLAIVALPAFPVQTQALWGTELQLVLQVQDGQWRIGDVWEDYPAH